MARFFFSFRNAVRGIAYTIRAEKNIKIQIACLVLALTAALLLNISRLELLLVFGISALVLSLEMANTAIERLADEVSPGHKKEIGIIKDVMAGAVLTASIFAALTGIIIFAQPLTQLFRS